MKNIGILAKIYHADFVNTPLVKYRKHSGNMSTDDELMLDVIGNILNKYCNPSENSPENETLFRTAYANYSYRKGIYNFSKNKYTIAREYFRDTLSLVPNYEDTRIRLIRTYFGKTGNRFISSAKSMVVRIRKLVPI